MSEVWLKANWRPVALAMLAPAIAVAGGVACAATGAGWVRWTGVMIAVFGAFMLLALSLLLRPRLQRDGDWLLVRLAFGKAERVPLDKVEVFFFGQGPAMAGPTAEEPDEDRQAQTGNVVVRLAESAKDLHRRPCERRLGHWCDGYIVIRGTYCQPLDKDVMATLNRRLVEYHRQRRNA